MLYLQYKEYLFNKTGRVGPNYTVYYDLENSWDEDFYLYGTGINVKTQSVSSAKRDGYYGWVYQYIEDSRKDPTLSNPEAWSVFVTLDDNKDYYTAVIYPAYQTKELVLTEHTLYDYLKGKKKVQLRENLLLYRNNRKKVQISTNNLAGWDK